MRIFARTVGGEQAMQNLDNTFVAGIFQCVGKTRQDPLVKQAKALPVE